MSAQARKLLPSSELAKANGLSPCSVTLSSETKESARRRGRMTEESSGQLSWTIPWKDVISSAVPLLSILGLALYALSSCAYGHFYSSLGTTSADVGLTYVGMLVASTGWAIALALGLAFVVLVSPDPLVPD